MGKAGFVRMETGRCWGILNDSIGGGGLRNDSPWMVWS